MPSMEHRPWSHGAQAPTPLGLLGPPSASASAPGACRSAGLQPPGLSTRRQASPSGPLPFQGCGLRAARCVPSVPSVAMHGGPGGLCFPMCARSVYAVAVGSTTCLSVLDVFSLPLATTFSAFPVAASPPRRRRHDSRAGNAESGLARSELLLAVVERGVCRRAGTAMHDAAML